MRNVMKAATLESKFPILSVEHDCIISKDADITVCYRVELPELFTVTQAEYEAIHSAWAKAVKVLPNYSIVHKQDFFIEESYTPELQKEDLSFLSRVICSSPRPPRSIAAQPAVSMPLPEASLSRRICRTRRR